MNQLYQALNYHIQLITIKIYKNNYNIILSVYYKYIFLNPGLIINNYDKPEIHFGKINFSISDKSLIEINNFVIN